jgi:hypothetical protein
MRFASIDHGQRGLQQCFSARHMRIARVAATVLVMSLTAAFEATAQCETINGRLPAQTNALALKRRRIVAQADLRRQQ